MAVMTSWVKILHRLPQTQDSQRRLQVTAALVGSCVHHRAQYYPQPYIPQPPNKGKTRLDEGYYGAYLSLALLVFCLFFFIWWELYGGADTTNPIHATRNTNRKQPTAQAPRYITGVPGTGGPKEALREAARASGFGKVEGLPVGIICSI